MTQTEAPYTLTFDHSVFVQPVQETMGGRVKAHVVKPRKWLKEKTS